MEPMETAVERLQKELDRLVPRNNTTQTVKVEGMGSMWNGIAIGIALGASMVCAAWVGFTLQNIAETQRNNEAFIQATYQQAPQIRAEFDRIKAQQEKK